jgi:uncharacterized delta-60 repeat protein
LQHFPEGEHVTMISAISSCKWPAIFSVFVIVSSTANTVAADPGDLDSEFGLHGRISSDIRLANLYPPEVSAITQGDGRIVAVGTLRQLEQSWSPRLFVARFEADGSPDLTFGNGGIISNVPLERGRSVIQQTDGQLVAVGSYQDDVVLIRLNQYGVADAAFGSGGIVQLDLGGEDLGLGLIEQADGRLVVAAQSIRDELDRDSDIVMLRLDQDGTLDPTFGRSGRIRIEFPDAQPQESNWESASEIAEDNSGRIVISGYRFHERVPNFVAANLVLARFSSDGVLDATFGDGGIVELPYGGNTTSLKPYALRILPDDGILVAGGIGGETGWGVLVPGDGFVARFSSDGDLDASFGSDGLVIEDFGGHGDFDAVAILADGSILAAGSTEMPIGDDDWQTDMSLTRFLATGQIDDSFGEAGTTLADFGGFGSAPRSQSASLLVDADDRAIVVGAGGQKLGMARFHNASPGFGGLIGLTEIQHSIAEGDTALEFVVRRTGGSTGAVSVEYRTIDGIAASGVEFAAGAGTLNWIDGDTSEKTITVDLLANSFSDGPQFEIELFDVQGGAALAASHATVNYSASEANGMEDQLPFSTVSGAVSNSGTSQTTSGGGSFGPTMLLCLIALAFARPRRFRAESPDMADARSW